MNNNKIEFVFFDVIINVFEHNLYELFDKNNYYIDKVKQDIFHVAFLVRTKKKKNKTYDSLIEKNIQILLFDIVHIYVYLIQQVYVNEMHNSYK